MEVVNHMKKEMGIREDVEERCPICHVPNLKEKREEKQLYIWKICRKCNSVVKFVDIVLPI